MITSLRCIREQKIPCLGICLGMQLMAIEYARNVLHISQANSLEFDKNCKPFDVITLLDSQKNIVNLGGTMRLGKQSSLLEKSLTREIYDDCRRLGKNHSVQEKFRHRYELHPDYAKKFHNTDFHIAGVSQKEGIVQFLELNQEIHPYYIGTQSHPELSSSLDDPAPLFVGLLKSISKK